mgnify:CR=1 FL=1
MSETKHINKRVFLKKSLLGIAGVILGNKLSGTTIINESPMDTFTKPSKTDKTIKEAMHYKVVSNGVQCELCPNYCILKEEKTGLCKTRFNKGVKLFTMAFGNPCAINSDPIEKKPLYHFYPTSRAFSIATAGCNFSCLNCQNWDISQVSPKETRNYDLPPAKVVAEALANNCKSIAYTYAEPIAFYDYVYETAKLAREKEIKNVFISNGYINEKPLRDIAKYLDAANINLKAFDDDVYKKLNGGKLQPILNTLKILKEEKVWIEITNLIIPSWTDKHEMIKKMCDWLYKNNLHEYPLHFSKFVPLYKLTHLPVTPVATLENAKEIALKAGIKYVYIGNVPGNEAENTFCPKCKNKIIERKGYKIIQNHIKNGKCSLCGEKISGIFE